MLLVKELKLSINSDEKQLKAIVEKRLKTKVQSFEIYKKSLDARKEPLYVYSVLVEVDHEEQFIGKNISIFHKKDLSPVYKQRNKTCIIVGYGPSGIFSAYHLAKAGYRVLVFEKGKRIVEREKDVDRFFKEGILDPESNVQYGEGGAGTFSDAKLTTRINNEYIGYILDVLVKHGGNPNIKYLNHAHIGTDKIRKIITSITDYLIDFGVEFHFSEEMTDLIFDENHLITKVLTNKGSYDCDYCLLGIGHSSYETVKRIQQKGIIVEKKDLAIGFRVEHPQAFIDQNQSNSMVSEANEYFLRYKGSKGVYSFCMCPGGMVIPAMSEFNSIVTNGMSNSLRNSQVANSAILIQVNKEEFIDGYEYLRKIEKAAYDYSDSYKALSQNIKDFMNNSLNDLIFASTYPLGTVLYDFNKFFNKNDLAIVKEALTYFDKKIPGFIEKGIMVGPESRSSSPVRITRDDKCRSLNCQNLYPMGEGAGYGGGIMSCSLDGIRAANAIISIYE